jgi:hypothetical protein
MAPEGYLLRAPFGDEEGSFGRSFPAINRRATIGPSLRDEDDLKLFLIPRLCLEMPGLEAPPTLSW